MLFQYSGVLSSGATGSTVAFPDAVLITASAGGATTTTGAGAGCAGVGTGVTGATGSRVPLSALAWE